MESSKGFEDEEEDVSRNWNANILKTETQSNIEFIVEEAVDLS